MANKISPEVFALLERIACDETQGRIATLALRNSDSLDFHDVSVSALRDMMARAYEAGRASAKKA